MKNLITFFLFIVTLTGWSQNLRTKGQSIVNDKGDTIILRGIGLGGHMLQEGYMLKVPFSGQQYVFKEHITKLIGKKATEKFYIRWLTNHTQKADIDSLKSWGFNSVRLPMHYNLYTLAVEDEPVKGKNTWLERGFILTDSLLNWCRENQMYLLLDMHATPGGQGHDVNISDRDPSKPSLWESRENQEKLIALWKRLAERYKDEPWIGGYDIINEPNWAFTGTNKNGIDEQNNGPLKSLMVEVTKAIRSVDKNHIIIIEGNGWGNNYNGILPPWDSNMVVSFHKYWNNNHQSDIQTYLDIRETYNVPIWLGETGENSNVWFTDAIRLMEQNNIGWCWWPLKKLGFNNPLEIKINPGYQELLDYWAGKGDKPSKKQAHQALMQLAEDTKIENNIIHYDVIDAMIRQIKSNQTKPFKSITIEQTATLNAVDYDLGQIGYAYYDKDFGNYYISTGEDRTPWNQGYTYRNDGVDIFLDSNKDLYVGKSSAGEWLNYTFNIEKTGTYEIVVRYQNNTKGLVQLVANHKSSVNVPLNESQNWINSDAANLQFQKGENMLKLLFLRGETNIKSISLKKIK
ncbi:cellulase family glycosylhydrolase [Galbibacter sp.]|uniref:cellulase family glycosylhydrolase n=1 Tax=Galbibacter sp. TaxID=2918471 RepID=UPI003A901B1D